MVKNTIHVGLLLSAFVKFLFIHLFIYFTSFLEKVASALIRAWERDAECLLVSPQGARACPLPQATQTSGSGCAGVRGRRGAPGALGFGYGFPPRLIVRTLGRCPPSSHISTVHHPQAPGAALSPLPRALLGALNNDICMQGAIHKYVRAGEI